MTPAASESSREDLIAAGDQGDGGAEAEIGLGKFGPGDAGPDDDEVLREVAQGIDLLPGEDAFAVRLRRGHHPRRGAGGDEDDIGGDLGAAIVALDLHHRGIHQRGRTGEDRDADLLEAAGDIVALGASQVEHAVVDPRQVRAGRGHLIAFVVHQMHPEPGRRVDHRHIVRRRDEGLARDAIGQHRRTTEAVTLDEGHLGADMGSDQRRFIPSRATADDDDPTACAHPLPVLH